MVFSGEQFTPLANLNASRAKAFATSSPTRSSPVPLITVGGLAKRWLVPGWRIGWIILHDPRSLFGFPIAQVMKDAATLSLAPSSFTQAAVPAILKDTPKSFYEEAMSVIEGSALLCAEELGKIDGLKIVRPRGSLYMLVGVDADKFVGIQDEWDFVQKLVWEEAVFPGELCFVFDDIYGA
jgi:tyrosine aminotransferase